MSTNERKIVVASLLVTGACIVYRSIPRVVTGVSFVTFLQAAALVAILVVVARNLKRVPHFFRSSSYGRPALVFGALVLVTLVGLLYSAFSSEAAAGRIYARVAPDFAKEGIAGARAMMHDFGPRLSSPLKVRVVDRIGAIGEADREVEDALRRWIVDEKDSSVRVAASRVLGKVMDSGAVLRTIVALSRADPDSRSLLADALKEKTKQQFGEDAARWREWFASTLSEKGGKDAFTLALAAYRAFPGDAPGRRRCLSVLDQAPIPSEHALQELLAESDPALRRVAAARATEIGGGLPLSSLGRALHEERDRAAARLEVRAIRKHGGPESDVALYRVVRDGSGAAGRAAAARALLGRTGAPDLPKVAATLYEKTSSSSVKRVVFPDLVRFARDSKAAATALGEVVVDRTEDSSIRLRALDALLGSSPKTISNDVLVGLLESDARTALARAARAALRRRTGKDGGADPKAWKKILSGR